MAERSQAPNPASYTVPPAGYSEAFGRLPFPRPFNLNPKAFGMPGAPIGAQVIAGFSHPLCDTKQEFTGLIDSKTGRAKYMIPPPKPLIPPMEPQVEVGKEPWPPMWEELLGMRSAYRVGVGAAGPRSTASTRQLQLSTANSSVVSANSRIATPAIRSQLPNARRDPQFAPGVGPAGPHAHVPAVQLDPRFPLELHPAATRGMIRAVALVMKNARLDADNALGTACEAFVTNSLLRRGWTDVPLGDVATASPVPSAADTAPKHSSQGVRDDLPMPIRLLDGRAARSVTTRKRPHDCKEQRESRNPSVFKRPVADSHSLRSSSSLGASSLSSHVTPVESKLIETNSVRTSSSSSSATNSRGRSVSLDGSTRAHVPPSAPKRASPVLLQGQGSSNLSTLIDKTEYLRALLKASSSPLAGVREVHDASGFLRLNPNSDTGSPLPPNTKWASKSRSPMPTSVQQSTIPRIRASVRMSPVLRVAPLSGDDYGSPNSRNPSSSPMLSDSSGGEGFPAGACASKGTVPHSPDARPSALARSHVRFPSTGATFGDGVPTGTDGPAVGIGCPAGVAIGTRHRTPKRPRECDVSSPTNTVPSVAGVVPSPSFDAMTDDTPAGEALPVAEDMFPRARSASAPDVPFNHYVEPNK